LSDAPTNVLCSVLVPVLNEAHHIEAAVRSMLLQQLDGEIEFLLIDGGSIDGTRELLARVAGDDARLRVLENPTGATPTSLNIGLRHARGRWVARMDAHSAYPADYLSRGIERLSCGDTRWVSGPQMPTGYNRVSRAIELALGTKLGTGAARRWGTQDEAGEWQLDSGVFCGVWARETLFEIGGWDERWLRNQDSEMAGRFQAADETLVCLPQMGAQYAPRGTVPALWRQYRQYGEYRERTAVRHPRTLRRSHLLAPAVVMAAPVALGGPAATRRLAQAVLAAYSGVLFGSGFVARRRAANRGDAALVPVVLGTMHLAHGCGFWRGIVRYGPPVAALTQACALPRLAARLTPASSTVYAPALADTSASWELSLESPSPHSERQTAPVRDRDHPRGWGPPNASSHSRSPQPHGDPVAARRIQPRAEFERSPTRWQRNRLLEAFRTSRPSSAWAR
jgi:succinoglycan biosynthesis protein ExoA